LLCQIFVMPKVYQMAGFANCSSPFVVRIIVHCL
jgi:hypothetical protein